MKEEGAEVEEEVVPGEVEVEVEVGKEKVEAEKK